MIYLFLKYKIKNTKIFTLTYNQKVLFKYNTEQLIKTEKFRKKI
jgi:glutamine cyclotransferase